MRKPVTRPGYFQAVAALLILLHSTPGSLAGEPDIPDIDPSAITVSGISSGGAMAQQLHLAYGDLFSGAGIIAGVPWGCAEGNLGLALGRCNGKEEGPLPSEKLLKKLEEAAAAGAVSDTKLLANDRVWLFHGALDSTVPGKVVDGVEAVYVALVDNDQISYVKDIEAAHLFPTRTAGGSCDTAAAPWLGACDYDAAGALLSHLYPDLERPSAALQQPDSGGSLISVDLPGGAAAGLAEEAWLFLPDACPEAGCRLHLALHGCLMAADEQQQAFVRQAGYLPWARANGIVVAFPQVRTQAVNPLGCWDWWGYTGGNYLERSGAQPDVLADWLRSLVEK